MSGALYIISAPSGAGKTSLVSQLIELDSHIVVSVSSTTRPMRTGEQNGVNYHFLTVEEFEVKIAENDFLEHAKVFDNYYGTSKSSVEEQLRKGKDVILEIDYQGAQQVRKIMPEATSIFILPPSKEELKRRLTGRGTDSEEVIAKRLAESMNEMSHYDEFDYLVINNHFQTALEELHSIFKSGRLLKTAQVNQHQNLIQQLLES
ncbi:guanylate kinase [Thiomicrorhabdus indica]|uniref:guanylate kinase n=1 Tax=Thiomicrorhabdus indica TaxID=2267253 RepID=UPI00102DDDE8|nr:guanylate kinase [Thiomicrorhabdus indica]